MQPKLVSIVVLGIGMYIIKSTMHMILVVNTDCLFTLVELSSKDLTSYRISQLSGGFLGSFQISFRVMGLVHS